MGWLRPSVNGSSGDWIIESKLASFTGSSLHFEDTAQNVAHGQCISRMDERQRYLPNYQETLVHYHKSFGVLQAPVACLHDHHSLGETSGPKLAM